ncbi:hypothetical protein HUJ04_009865 [Dendroctonus ponderosae]|nr:hypothetical protein HUJ04_009865 [Dendroctonus ponderosae]
MNPSWVFLSVLVFWMVFLGIIQAGSIDETRPHIKDLHRQSHHAHGSVKHHQKHHEGLKTRTSNSSTCISVFELELISRGAERTDVLLGNLRDLFGFTNGTISSNLFNVTHWEQVLSPSGISHVVEGGIETLANIPSILGYNSILWLTILLRARMCKEDHDIVFSLPSCMWFVYGALLKQGSTSNPRTDSSRIIFSTWWIFITILTAFYTANLTAFLTLSKFTLPISEPKDISRKHNKWITNRGNGIVEQLYLSKKYANGDGNSLFEEIGMSQWEKINGQFNMIKIMNAYSQLCSQHGAAELNAHIALQREFSKNSGKKT